MKENRFYPRTFALGFSITEGDILEDSMNFPNVFAHEGEEMIETVVPSLGETIRANVIQFSLIANGTINFG